MFITLILIADEVPCERSFRLSFYVPFKHITFAGSPTVTNSPADV